MGAYSDILNIMRDQGARFNHEGLLLAVMTGDRSCKIGDFLLEAQDLMIAQNLLSPTATKVKVAGEANTDQSEYLPALQSGDVVVVYRISDTKYVILERVVQA